MATTPEPATHTTGPGRQEAEALLWVRLQARDRDALEAFFDRFSVQVTGLLRRSLAREDVADLTQEVFVQLLSNLDRVRWPDRLEAWVRGVTLNTLRNELRRRRWRRFVTLRSSEGEGAGPEVGRQDDASHETRALLRVVQRFLSRLPAEEHLAFCLRYFEQLELTECAEALGCSLATAKRRLARAKATLELELSIEGETSGPED